MSPDNLDKAVGSVRDEIERLLAEGPDEAEMADERASMAGSYRVGLASPSGVARYLSASLAMASRSARLDAARGRSGDADRRRPRGAAPPRRVRRLAVAVAGELEKPEK